MWHSGHNSSRLIYDHYANCYNTRMSKEKIEKLMGRRERKKQQTRDALEATAWRLFQRKGYDATTVEDMGSPNTAPNAHQHVIVFFLMWSPPPARPLGHPPRPTATPTPC